MGYPSFNVGEVLTANDMNAVGLWRVTNCTVTSAGGTAATASNGVITFGTGNTSVTVSNAFSADFLNYRIVVNGGAGSATGALRLTLGATATGYYYGGKARTYGAADLNIELANGAFWYAAETSTNGLSGVIELQNPQVAARTLYQTVITPPRTDAYWLGAGGYLNDASQYTSFTLTVNGASQTGGTIRVYGYRN